MPGPVTFVTHMKVLIAGLGNPGPEYADTRHNIGFQVLDHLASAAGIRFRSERYAEHAELRHKGRLFILIEPATYMNLSGKAVRYWMEKENIAAGNLLVITDDIALPFGAIRIRAKGGPGGHNGLTSVCEVLATEDFARLRFGIGSDFPRGRQSEYVLGRWSEDESQALPQRIELAAKAVLQFGLLGVAEAMNNFNNR